MFTTFLLRKNGFEIARSRPEIYQVIAMKKIFIVRDFMFKLG